MSIKNKLDKVLSEFEEKNLNFLESRDMRVLDEKELTDEEPKKEIPNKGSVEDKIVSYLSENPNPSDEELHSWAEKESLNIHEVETAIYKLATKMVKFLVGGLSVQKGIASSAVNATELKMGAKVEKEHTTDEETAIRIATDHLAEIPDYYTRLKKMEDDAKKEKKDSTTVTESINIDNLKKFDKSRTQTAVKRAIDTLIELEEQNVFEGTDASYARSVIAVLQRVSHKLKNVIKG